MRFLCSIGCLLSMLAIAPACAEGLSGSGSTSARDKLFQSQSRLLDGRLSSQYRASTRYSPNYSATASAPASIPRYRGNYRGVYLEEAKSAARKHGIPEDLFLRLVQQESGFNPRARSHKGAIGLAQLMPQTARALRVDPPASCRCNPAPP